MLRKMNIFEGRTVSSLMWYQLECCNCFFQGYCKHLEFLVSSEIRCIFVAWIYFHFSNAEAAEVTALRIIYLFIGGEGLFSGLVCNLGNYLWSKICKLRQYRQCSAYSTSDLHSWSWNVLSCWWLSVVQNKGTPCKVKQGDAGLLKMSAGCMLEGRTVIVCVFTRFCNGQPVSLFLSFGKLWRM